MPKLPRVKPTKVIKALERANFYKNKKHLSVLKEQNCAKIRI